MATTGTKLSRREAEVMDVLFRKKKATAREVWSALGEERTYSTIRKLLSILEGKGHVAHQRDGAAFVYHPKQGRESAAKSALSRVVNTFFEGSVEGAVAGLLGGSKVTTEELQRIEQLIEQAKENSEKETGE